MREVFADTFYFIAVLGRDLDARRNALAAGADRNRRMVTTAWVLTEVANFLDRPHERQAFIELAAALGRSRQVLLLPCEDDLWRRGLTFYGSRLDKEWSLTDCISFVVMSERRITDALTGDHHFEQAGFTALLRSR
jgi:predicted nucleic acid-binding protein